MQILTRRLSADVGQSSVWAGEIAAKRQEVESIYAIVQTQAAGPSNLIEQATNAQARDMFEQEAAAYQAESKSMWKWGIGVLVAASVLAILPILLYYADHSFLEKNGLVWAHFGPAVALGSVSGVLLSRSRGRDRARQKAKNLSVALSTMFAYSSLISDEAERQRFVHDMGRTVIEAFLRHDPAAPESDGLSLLDALKRS